MRDAFGGVFMIRFFIVFVFILVGFSAISLNYAKAFRLKNSVIDFIEQSEIINLDDYFSTASGTKDLSDLNAAITRINYNKTCTTSNKITTSEGTGYCYKGVVILKNREETIYGTNGKTKIIYYNVMTYADWNIAILNKILALGGQSENSEAYVAGTWKVAGEAKVVARS